MSLREDFYIHLHDEFCRGVVWLSDSERLSETDFDDSLSKSGKPEKKKFYISKKRMSKENFLELKNNANLDKFRCVGSSARFVYSTLHKVSNIEFERTLVAGIVRPHLDAHFVIDDFEYYVEGKCAEIYDKPSKKFRATYLDSIIFNEFISDFYKSTDRKSLFRGKEPKKFIKEDLKPKIENDTFVLESSDFGIQSSITRFDFKQFICHIIGIAYGLPKSIKPKRLIYLYYDDDWNGGRKAITEFIEDFKAIHNGFKTFLESKKIELCLISHNEFGPIDCDKLMEKIESSKNETLAKSIF